MKSGILLLILFVLVSSCNKNDDGTEVPGFIGKWKLAEVLMDPGDGSGTFHSVESSKTIEFFSNGTVTSNGSLCMVSVQADQGTSGTYTLTDSTITSSDCNATPVKTSFAIDGVALIISYPCIEACKEKYFKVDD